MSLTKKDLALLIHIDKDPESDLVPEADERIKRLLKAGLIDESIDLTAEGVEAIERIQTLTEKLSRGIPMAERKQVDPEKVYTDRAVALWRTGTVGKKPVVTDGTMIYVGKPVAGMKAEKGSTDARKMLPRIVAQQKGDYVEVTPTYYQTNGKVLGIELVWLENKEAGVRAAIQAMYYDFVLNKFPSAKWLATNEKVAVKASVKGKGITKDNVVALVMPYLTTGWKEPGRGDAK